MGTYPSHFAERTPHLLMVLRDVCLPCLELPDHCSWQHGPEELHRGGRLGLDAHGAPQCHLRVHRVWVCTGLFAYITHKVWATTALARTARLNATCACSRRRCGMGSPHCRLTAFVTLSTEAWASRQCRVQQCNSHAYAWKHALCTLPLPGDWVLTCARLPPSRKILI